MSANGTTERLRRGDPELFEGPTAAHALGWLDHPTRYLTGWLGQIETRLPRRHRRTLLLGMGGSSSPARFWAEADGSTDLSVLDTSNPDTVSAVDFENATVIASSKSGTTVETQTLLAHALARGLDPRDLVVITDPGTTLAELATSLGGLVIEGDPNTGGRYSALSPFGLVPALYAGWTASRVSEEVGVEGPSDEVVAAAMDEAADITRVGDRGLCEAPLRGDPTLSGGSLWLEQLLAETTGKQGRGVVPVPGGDERYRPAEMMYFHLVAAWAARLLGVDPFDQPDVERAKRGVFELLAGEVPDVPDDRRDLEAALTGAAYRTLQVYAALDQADAVATLRSRVAERFGTTTANLGPRYLHSTGQLHKGGPTGVLGVQVVVRPTSPPERIQGRNYTFHDLHRAQALSDARAMSAAGRSVRVMVVDDLDEAASILGVAS